MRRWLVDYRTKKGLTQEETATKCGISRQYYSFIESGARNCPVKTAKKIAEVLGFPWTLFFNDSTEPAAEIANDTAEIGLRSAT